MYLTRCEFTDIVDAVVAIKDSNLGDYKTQVGTAVRITYTENSINIKDMYGAEVPYDEIFEEVWEPTVGKLYKFYNNNEGEYTYSILKDFVGKDSYLDGYGDMWDVCERIPKGDVGE